MDVNQIICGECLPILRDMADNSVDTIVADPPYGIGFMGKKWDYNVPSVEVWQECLRVLKPGGTLLCFAGSRTQHRMAVNVEDAGFILKDCIMWLYGSGFPKAHDIGKSVEKVKVGGIKNLKQIGSKKGIKCETGTQGYSFNQEYVPGKCMGGKQISGDIPVYEITNEWNGWKSHGLKPAYEPILVAMKPNDGTYANNALVHGVSGLNIDGGRIGTEGGVKKINIKPNSASHGGEGFGCNGQLEQLNKDRYPANIILDEEAGRMLDEQSGISKPKKRREGKKGGSGFGYFDDEKTKNTNGVWPEDGGGGASRFFYCAKASKKERNAGCEGLPKGEPPASARSKPAEGRNAPLGKPRSNHHPTVKPLALMEYLCALTKTPTGGLVLDPFCGSGTTCLAAKNTGRDYIGIEREPEYCEIAKARLKKLDKEQGGLFS